MISIDTLLQRFKQLIVCTCSLAKICVYSNLIVYRMNLNQKIDALYRLRKFPEMLSAVGITYDGNPLISRLFQLQLAIYHLDLYLESNWRVESSELDKLWVSIRMRMGDLEVSEKKIDAYLAHLAKYQYHELQLRHGKLPNRLAYHYYYFYKSCDVKLLRRILMDHYPVLKRICSTADWRYFDLITEFHDDIEDIIEDLETINGNGYLIQIMENGLSGATDKFRADIVDIVEQSESRATKNGRPFFQQIHEWTMDEALMTKVLLDQQCNMLHDIDIFDSRLASYLAVKSDQIMLNQSTAIFTNSSI